MSFAKNLIAARTRMNYSSKELAQKIGISPTTYSNYELGLREPKFDILRKISNALQVSTDYLLNVDVPARHEFYLNQGLEILKELGYYQVENPFDYYKYGEFNICFSVYGNENYLLLPGTEEQTNFVAFKKQDFIRLIEEATLAYPDHNYQIAQRKILSDYISNFLSYEGAYKDWVIDLERIANLNQAEHPENWDRFYARQRSLAKQYRDVVLNIKGFLSGADEDFIIKTEADMSYLYHHIDFSMECND